MTIENYVHCIAIQRWIKNDATCDDLINVIREINRITGKWQEITPLHDCEINEELKDLQPCQILSRIVSFPRDKDFTVISEQGNVIGLTSCAITDKIRANALEVAIDIIHNLDNISLPIKLCRFINKFDELVKRLC